MVELSAFTTYYRSRLIYYDCPLLVKVASFYYAIYAEVEFVVAQQFRASMVQVQWYARKYIQPLLYRLAQMGVYWIRYFKLV